MLRPRLKPEAKKPPNGAIRDAKVASTSECTCTGIYVMVVRPSSAASHVGSVYSCHWKGSSGVQCSSHFSGSYRGTEPMGEEKRTKRREENIKRELKK